MARHQWKSSVLKLMSLAPIAASVWLSLPAPAQAAQYNYCFRYVGETPLNLPHPINAKDKASADAQARAQIALQNAAIQANGSSGFWYYTEGLC